MGSLPRISIDLPTSAPDQDAAQSAEAGDRYRFLNESDIVGGLAAVEEHYRSAIARCESALLADLKAFLDRQTSCLDIAYQCLGGRDVALHRSDLDFDDSSGSWITVIEPRLFEIAARYRNELAQPAPDMASILEDAEDLYGRVPECAGRFWKHRGHAFGSGHSEGRECVDNALRGPSLTWAWQYLRHPAGSTATDRADGSGVLFRP